MGISTKYEILICYSIFLFSFISLQSMLGINAITGNVPNIELTTWDKIINFFNLFNFTTSIGLINDIVIFPFVVFLSFITLNWIRGVD